MRTTKILSISLPPAQLKDAEKLARKETRTLSELVREALRRYQQPRVSFDASEYIISRVAPTPPALEAIRQDATAKGTDKLTEQQVKWGSRRRLPAKRQEDR